MACTDHKENGKERMYWEYGKGYKGSLCVNYSETTMTAY